MEGQLVDLRLYAFSPKFLKKIVEMNKIQLLSNKKSSKNIKNGQKR